MSQVEENHLTKDFVQKANWTKEEARKVVAYVAMEKKPKMEKIKEPGELREPGKGKPLTKDKIIHLHQTMGHLHPNRIKDLVKETKMWDNNTLKAINDLNHCEVCAVEHNRIPRPKIAPPRAIGHNHVIAIDLKENRRYKNAPPYILYIFDVFSRFKAACFINNKRGETIAEHLVTEWIKHHGPPKYIMSDRGNEF